MVEAGSIKLLLGWTAYEAQWRVEAGALYVVSEHGSLRSAASEAPEEQAARLLTAMIYQSKQSDGSAKRATTSRN